MVVAVLTVRISLPDAIVDRGDAGASLDLVGVDDWGANRQGYGRGYDLEQAIAGRDPDRAAVLLAHQPANFREAAALSIKDLEPDSDIHASAEYRREVGAVMARRALVEAAERAKGR